MGRAQFTAELIFKYSNYLQTLKYKAKAILMSKNIKPWHGGRVEHYEQIFLLGWLPIPNQLQVINSGTKIKIETSSNFKGFQTFMEKSDNFYKILSSQAWLEDNFTLAHLYLNIGSSFTSEKKDLVKFRLNRAGHLRVLLPP
jgi:hypothetical protein